VLATAAAGTAYQLFGGAPDARPLAFAVAVAGAAGAYFMVTTTLVAFAVAWSRGASPLGVWHADFLWTAPGYVVGAAAAAAFVAALGHVSALVLLLAVAVPALLTYRSYHVYFERLADEQRRVREVSDLHLATVEALAAAIDAKDNAFTQHVRRVERLAGRLAQQLGMSEGEIRGVKTAALLHDIGKLAVPEYILSKPGPLTAEEFARVRPTRASAPRSSRTCRSPTRWCRSSARITSAGTARATRTASPARTSRSARGSSASSTTTTR
jgi:hypothetical protein